MSSTSETSAPEPRSARAGLVRLVLRQPLAVAAILFLLLVLLAMIFAGQFAPYSPLAQNLGAILQGPSSHHLLGTDSLGRDILSRLIWGARPTLIFVFITVAVATVVGVIGGLIAGYCGGAVDSIIGRCSDVLLAMPVLIVILAVLAVFPNAELVAMIVLGVLYAPRILLVVRSVTLSVRQDLYVDAAKVDGLNTAQILRRHILSRTLGPIIVQISLAAGQTLLVVVGLSFLGLVTQVPNPSWGGMVAEASTVVTQSTWMLIPTGITITLTVLAFGILGDAVRDATAALSSGHLPVVSRAAPRVPVAEGELALAADAGDALLSMRGLSIAFSSGSQGWETVVRDVSFDVLRGQVTGLIGESGSGKTVTALAAIGLLGKTGRIVAGSCWFDGLELATAPASKVRALRGRRIAFISQEPMASLDPVFTVGSQLGELVRRHQHTNRAETRSRVIELLRLVNLRDPELVASRYPHQLSGGMAQRVAIALALAGQPDLLIADEPTTALDVTVQAEILGLLRRLRSEMGLSILLVTHDWGVVADICDRAVVMYAGEVVETGSVEQLFTAPRHPYTWALRSCDPGSGGLAERFVTIGGVVPAPNDWPAGCHFAARCRFARTECSAAAIPLVSLGDGQVSRCVLAEDPNFSAVSLP